MESQQREQPLSATSSASTDGLDVQVFFTRHPVLHVVYGYSFLFTFNTAWDVLFPHLDAPPSFNDHILRVALRTVFMSGVFVLAQRWRWKVRSSNAAK